jgi:hypothetical protein
MFPLLSLHAIAAQRGDGLHPVLLAGLERLAAGSGEHAVAESGRNTQRTAGPAGDHVAGDWIAKSRRGCE